MKVLLLAENWSGRGGIQNYLQNIVKYLPVGGVEVIEPSQRRFFWPLTKPKWLPLSIALYKKVKRARASTQPYQVLLCGKALFEGLVGYYLKKYLGLPYVIFTYAMEIEVWAKQPRTRRKLQRVIRAADRIIYINEETKKQLSAAGATERQLVKIWPGISEEWFRAVAPETIPTTLEKFKIKPPYILAVGRLVPRKGFDVLIEAFSQLDQVKHGEVQLVIVGDGPEAGALRQVAQQHFVHTSVHLVGVVSGRDLPAFYAGALVFAMTPKTVPANSEGFGIVYLEAGAVGLPVVGTQGGGVSEAILHKQTGMVVQRDSASAVTRALTYFLEDEGARKRMGEAGKKRAWDEFRWSKRIMLVKGVIDAVVTEQVMARRRN